jgi:hypothetical protein
MGTLVSPAIISRVDSTDEWVVDGTDAPRIRRHASLNTQARGYSRHLHHNTRGRAICIPRRTRPHDARLGTSSSLLLIASLTRLHRFIRILPSRASCHRWICIPMRRIRSCSRRPLRSCVLRRVIPVLESLGESPVPPLSRPSILTPYSTD